MKKKKVFSLAWVYEALEEDPTFETKRMFGGLAVYYFGRMVLVLVENSGEREYRGKTYPYEIWNGILFPTSREFHDSIQKDLREVSSHPVLGKWLYLPMEAPSFEEEALRGVDLIYKRDPRFGIEPKAKK